MTEYIKVVHLETEILILEYNRNIKNNYVEATDINRINVKLFKNLESLNCSVGVEKPLTTLNKKNSKELYTIIRFALITSHFSNDVIKKSILRLISLSEANTLVR